MSERKLFGGPYNGRVLDIQHPDVPIVVAVPRPFNVLVTQPLTEPTYDTVHYVPSPNGFPTMVVEEKDR